MIGSWGSRLGEEPPLSIALPGLSCSWPAAILRAVIRTVRKLKHLIEPLERQPHLGRLTIVDAIDEGDAHLRLHDGARDELDALGEVLHGAGGRARGPGRVEGGEQELPREAVEAEVLCEAEEDRAVREAVLEGDLARLELAKGVVHLGAVRVRIRDPTLTLTLLTLILAPTLALARARTPEPEPEPEREPGPEPEPVVHLVAAVLEAARAVEVVAVSDAEVAPQALHPHRVDAVVHLVRARVRVRVRRVTIGIRVRSRSVQG